jgi:hypothetical protein
MTVTLQTWHFASGERSWRTSRGREQRIVLNADTWCREDVELLAFDRRVHELEDDIGAGAQIELVGTARSIAQMKAQFTLRYQRLFSVRNAASKHERFDELLTAHAALHDRRKPLVRADHDHALDVWQWTLRLDPEADEALQIAALFHDIERLASEPDVRIEQHAEDYLGFKLSHARRGAQMVADVLHKLALPSDVAARAFRLVERHEQPEHDRDLCTLNDADALSWFALNSAGFLTYFGAEHTRKKVAYTFGRMRSSAARAYLGRVRLERALTAMLEDHLCANSGESRSTREL